MSRTPHDDKLHAALITFVAEAIPYLRNATDTKKIPTVARFELRDEQIVRVERPNWWQVNSYMSPVLELSSFKHAVIACSEHPLLRTRNGKRAEALNVAGPLFFNLIPEKFLTECIAREDGLIFRRRTFEGVFCDLFNFLTPSAKNRARLIAPFDNVQLDKKEISLPPNARVRQLSPLQIVDMANHCPMLRHYYGHGLHRWFNTVFEIEFSFEWQWTDMDEDGHSPLEHIGTNHEPALVHRLMEEIILLRSLLGKPLSSPTYVIDYRGWDSVKSTGGSIHNLPWVRPTSPWPLVIQKSESAKFSKLRNKFMNIKDMTIKRRIFAAIRRYSSSMEKFYSGDRLLDAVAGLEGLLVDSKTEVRHKFAEHTALLLEKQLTKRISLNYDMRSSYDFRSRIGHGGVVADNLFAIMGSSNISNKDLEEFNAVNRLSERCSKCLHKAIAICIENEKVNFDWDKAVMSSKRLLCKKRNTSHIS